MTKKIEYDREFIDKLKRLPMIDYVKSIVGPEKISYSGNCYSLCCPHPDHDDRNPSFRIWENSDGTNSWACMSCHSGKKDEAHGNYGSDIIAFVRWMSDYKGSQHILSFNEAQLEIAKFYKLQVPSYLNRHKKMSYNDFLQYAYHKNFVEYCSSMRNYFYNRGFDMSDAEKWGIGSNGTQLYFPLYDQHDDLKGFIWRNFDTEPKYMHSSREDGFVKSEYLYGINDIDKSSTTAYITEGTFDVMMARKYGLKNVFAVLGKAFKESHAILLKSLGFTKVIIALDGDSAGIGAVRNAAQAARNAGFFCSVAILPDDMDMCDFFNKYKQDGVKKLKQYIEPIFVYVFKHMADSYLRSKYVEQEKNLTSILEYQKDIKDKDELILFNNYINTHFDIKMSAEVLNASQIKTNLENIVSRKETSSTAKQLCG